MMFMSIDSAEANSISVDKEQSFLDLYTAKAYMLHNTASRGRYKKAVEIWKLAAPFLRCFYRDQEFDLCAVCFLRARFDDLLLTVKQRDVHRHRMTESNLYLQGRVKILIIQKSRYMYILNVFGRKCSQSDVSVDTTESLCCSSVDVIYHCTSWVTHPLILIFDIRAIAPFVHLNGKNISTAKMHEVCDIELSRISGAFGVSHVRAVDPNFERRINTVET